MGSQSSSTNLVVRTVVQGEQDPTRQSCEAAPICFFSIWYVGCNEGSHWILVKIVDIPQADATKHSGSRLASMRTWTYLLAFIVLRNVSVRPFRLSHSAPELQPKFSSPSDRRQFVICKWEVNNKITVPLSGDYFFSRFCDSMFYEMRNIDEEAARWNRYAQHGSVETKQNLWILIRETLI